MPAVRTEPTLTAMASQRPDPETFVRRHQQALWRYARGLGAPSDLAEDLVQEAFVTTLRRFRGGPDAAAFVFLRTTLRHLWLRQRRDDRRREELLVEAADRLWERTQSDLDGGARWLDELRACTERLEGRAREALDRFYGRSQSRAEIAAAFGMVENGVKTLLQRARALLRDCMDRRQEDQS